MPFPSFDSINANTVEELVESLEKQRKEMQWLLQSLDTMNVKELHADVINAGRIKAEFLQIGADTEFENGYNPLDALEMATDAFNESIATGQVLDLWKYPGTTLIDGGNIFTNSITANAINVSQLSAISANLGNINAGTIRGIDIYGSMFESQGGNDYVRIENGEIAISNALGGIPLFINQDRLYWDLGSPYGYVHSIEGRTNLDIYSSLGGITLESRFNSVKFKRSVDFSEATVTGLTVPYAESSGQASWASSAGSANSATNSYGLFSYNNSSIIKLAFNASGDRIYFQHNGVVKGYIDLKPDG